MVNRERTGLPWRFSGSSVLPLQQVQAESLVREEPTRGRVWQEIEKEEDSVGHQIFVGSTLILLTFLFLEGS